MKKRISGTVISDKMDKTRVIEVTRQVVHPLYKKRYKVTKHFYAHDADNSSKLGQVVTIEETRPLSRLKRWRIVEAAAVPVESSSVEEGEERALTGKKTPRHSPRNSTPRHRGKVSSSSSSQPRVTPPREKK